MARARFRETSCDFVDVFVMTSQAPALEMRGITKSFAGNVVLAGVSLAARAGEVHALVGENGRQINVDEDSGRGPSAGRRGDFD